MEFLKSRSESKELLSLRVLNVRMTLSTDDSSYYWNLEKGFEGEKKFDKMLKTLPENCLILNDLLLKVNNSKFQIDSLLLFMDSIFPIDVKNFEGDVIIDGHRWYKKSGKEIKNPLLQLQRSESLLRQLLQEIGYSSPVNSHLVFVNPDFYLYQASIEHPIIFPPQNKRFIDKLAMKHSKVTQKHYHLAKKLLSLHLKDSLSDRKIEYNFEELRKGIYCLKCNSFNSVHTKSKLVCQDCGFKEDVTSAVLRSVKEVNLLFPDLKITINTVYEWCGSTVSKKTIRSILSEKLKLVGYGRSARYI